MGNRLGFAYPSTGFAFRDMILLRNRNLTFSTKVALFPVNRPELMVVNGTMPTFGSVLQVSHSASILLTSGRIH